MSVIKIKKGKDIKIKGAADKEIFEISLPKTAAVQPPDFKGLKPRLAAKLDDVVKVGSPIIEDKTIPEIKIVSPLSGKVIAVNRGDKRALLEVVIESDGKQEAEQFTKYSEGDIASLSKEKITEALLAGGLWPAIRQRPFSKIANPSDTPKSIFIHAMNTEPLAADVDLCLEGREAQFQAGLDIIQKLTDKDVHLCISADAKSKALTDAKGVKTHRFSGPHPAGNVSTHIHNVDPINKGDIVWYVEAQDVVRIASLLTSGTYPIERVVAVTGEGAKERKYAKTIVGAPLKDLLGGSDLNNQRCITGSVLAGRSVGADGFVGFYDSQISIIPEGGEREFLGWLMPGFNKYTISKTFASAFTPEREYSLDTDKNGGDRAIVLNNLYDAYVPLDVVTFFLLRAVIAGDIEEAEKLGILECDEEDFALCTFACPSKTDVGAIIRDGLETIEKEG